MLLSDVAIRAAMDAGEIKIEPFDAVLLKEGSYTFRLAAVAKRLKGEGALDLRTEKPAYEDVQIGDGWVLNPGDFIVGITMEHVTLGAEMACFFTGRGSLAQVGIDTLQSSAFAEPKSDWPMKMEISNHGPRPIVLYTGMPLMKGMFCQVR